MSIKEEEEKDHSRCGVGIRIWLLITSSYNIFWTPGEALEAERGRERGREGGREGEREKEREGGREKGREGYCIQQTTCSQLFYTTRTG